MIKNIKKLINAVTSDYTDYNVIVKYSKDMQAFFWTGLEWSEHFHSAKKYSSLEDACYECRDLEGHDVLSRSEYLYE